MTRPDAALLLEVCTIKFAKSLKGESSPEPIDEAITKRLIKSLDPVRLRLFCRAFKGVCREGHTDPMKCGGVTLEATRVGLTYLGKRTAAEKNRRRWALSN